MVKFNPNHSPVWTGVYAVLTTVVGFVAWSVAGGTTTADLQEKYPEDRIKSNTSKGPYNEKKEMMAVLMGKGESNLGKLREETTKRRLQVVQDYKEAQEKLDDKDSQPTNVKSVKS